MANIHDVFKTDDVNGVIIGGDYIAAKLCYDGRQQGRIIYANSPEQAKNLAIEIKVEFRQDLGDTLFKEIYPDDLKWQIIYLS